MSKSYDPKLRAAMAEIKQTLKEFNIAGMITLQSESHTEFALELEPSWSLLRFVREGKAVHIKIYHSRQPQLNQTCSMIYSFRDLVAMFFSQFDDMAKLIESHSKVVHPKFSPSIIRNDDREDDDAEK